jgi:ABC-type antimicrobial peptide transport system permease subunit
VLFGSLALIVAAVGLFGLSYNVSRRTGEIGVRIAVGAQYLDVLRLVRESMLPVLAGVVVGLATAMAASRLVSTLLFGSRDCRCPLRSMILMPAAREESLESASEADAPSRFAPRRGKHRLRTSEAPFLSARLLASYVSVGGKSVSHRAAWQFRQSCRSRVRTPLKCRTRDRRP